MIEMKTRSCPAPKIPTTFTLIFNRPSTQGALGHILYSLDKHALDLPRCWQVYIFLSFKGLYYLFLYQTQTNVLSKN